MLGSSGHLCSSEQPRASSRSPSDRNQKKNHASKLRELALLLPVALKTVTKKLTKKEILLHVLHYIHYLQRSINVAKALLKFHTSDGEGGLGGLGRNSAVGPSRRRHSTPSSSPRFRNSHLWGACRKPRKKKLSRAAERQTRSPKPRRSLALDKSEELVTTFPDQKQENMGRTVTPLRCPRPCSNPNTASASPQGDGGGKSQLTLDVDENIIFNDIDSCCYTNGVQDARPDPIFEAQREDTGIYFLNRTHLRPRQSLVYSSSKEVDKNAPDTDPWLPVCTPEGSPHGSPLDLGPLQINTWSVTGDPSEILGLSPSLFSSPGKLLPDQILEDGTEYLTQALFEEVFLEPESPHSACALEAPQEKDKPSEAREDPPGPHVLCQSSVSLDHCYLSLSENSKMPSSSSSEDTDMESLWEQEEDMQTIPEGLQPSSDEEDDYTWTPTRRASTLSTAGRKTRKGRASRGPPKPKESEKAPCTIHMKKKCVNGFIMFCRMNRKQYIRACPGTASTAATKELAQLWRVMTERERRPYCIKARRFSRLHNRIVKQEDSNSEEDWETPKPFYQLLAEKARRSRALTALLPSQHQ